MSDRIFVRDLAVVCIVGIHPKERVTPQTVLINLCLECDLAPAGRSDRIEDTVDYKVLKDRVVREISQSQHFLIEKMAEHVAGICLQDARVKSATVTVDKPGALTGARSVAVEITRSVLP